ncbi:flagellar export chaperone FliS [Thiorhodovibrio frisius]|uniref:Flagellar secretion chaperone FliS n=1 Tax=Thiorhodovibrio frisius TaxID=631362 RepID=H8Z5B3_9GAMM|nr:flagellar export chaperone FliS [Thiorhodovibrio frisius]EIC20520.1 flagellar biosynthetic protein FliS [Thiorhodovibrio frisius]WPL21264.1 Flagellar protein FliS [Thiorhodovibrio frisius]
MYAIEMKKSTDQYRQAGVLSEISVASPHRIIQLLFEGALERIAVGKGAMLQGNIAKKGEQISKAINIIDGLRGVLDHEKGGELAERLDALYEYMSYQLLQANLRDNPDALDEVTKLLREVKSGWDEIPEELRNSAG